MNFKTRFLEIVEGKVVGASASIVKGGEIVEYVNFGKKSLENKTDITNETIFRIASISKIVVAMAVMKLIEEKKANLDDDIGDILGFRIRNPHHPNEKITIRMLMLQTSSITDGYDDENSLYDNVLKGYNGVNGTSLPVILHELLTPSDSKYYTPLTFDKNKPGSRFIYSNFGCGILACIVEALSGELFTDYVEKNFFIPLGLDASFRACNINKKEDIASLYYPTNDANNPYELARSSESFIDSCYPLYPLKENFRGPAGGLFISMKDLSKIMIVLMNDGVVENKQILKKETIDLMLQMHYLGPNIDYSAKGLQMRFLDLNGKILKGHTGNAYGLRSFLFFNKEEDIGICFVTNGGYFNLQPYGLTDIQEEVLTSFLDKYYPEKTSIHQFSFKVNEDYGYFDNRKIVFPTKPIVQNDEVYLPLLSLASALNIIPKIKKGFIDFNYQAKSYSIPYNLDDKFHFVPLFEVLNNLEINYTINDKITINF